ncbi:hypothetical protein F5884DRAFT_228063 [Xylogone sp. PMI_703]|nr:hypothetical protein F5884DRAFT_228063 [Xylogone sp. PMI_703]
MVGCFALALLYLPAWMLCITFLCSNYCNTVCVMRRGCLLLVGELPPPTQHDPVRDPFHAFLPRMYGTIRQLVDASKPQSMGWLVGWFGVGLFALVDWID